MDETPAARRSGAAAGVTAQVADVVGKDVQIGEAAVGDQRMKRPRVEHGVVGVPDPAGDAAGVDTSVRGPVGVAAQDPVVRLSGVDLTAHPLLGDEPGVRYPDVKPGAGSHYP